MLHHAFFTSNAAVSATAAAIDPPKDCTVAFKPGQANAKVDPRCDINAIWMSFCRHAVPDTVMGIYIENRFSRFEGLF